MTEPANASLVTKSWSLKTEAGALMALMVYPPTHPDRRGAVTETYRESWFPTVPPIKQLVKSQSEPATLRGMHLHRSQWDIWHFVRRGATVRLYDTASGEQQFIDTLWTNPVIAIPPGISHGFYAPEGCTLVYALTAEYTGDDEFGWFPFDGLRPDDEWPLSHEGLHVSDRDLTAPRLADFKG